MGTQFLHSRFDLELGSRPAGTLLGVDAPFGKRAGAASGPYAPPADDFGVKMTLRCGAGMSREFYQWIGGTFARTVQRRSGAVSATELSGGNSAAPAHRLEFYDALIVEVQFPALDKGSRKQASMTVKLRAERSKLTSSKSPARQTSKPWLMSNFRFRIDGLESACQQVASVSAISATNTVKSLRVGAERFEHLEPAGLEFGNLVIALPASGAAAPGSAASGFKHWFEDETVRGRGAKERNGSLEYLSPGGQPYLRLGFKGLGILGITQNGRTEVKLYFESVSVSVP